MIYVIRAGNTDLYKIGYTSKSVSSRIASLQTGNPYKLIHIISLEGDTICERMLHKRFGSRKYNGEWFKLSKSDLSLLTDKEWYKEYVLVPCDLYRSGVIDPCSCMSSDCLFCSDKSYSFTEDYIFDNEFAY